MQKILMCLIATLILTGCSRFPLLYHPDIQQGNIISPDMLSQLKVGMPVEQVRYIMGAPVLTSTFDMQRWDYVYTYKPGKGAMTSKVVTVHFENGVVKAFDSK